jgi:hypothetical protein
MSYPGFVYRLPFVRQLARSANDIRNLQGLNIRLSRGAATASLRTIIPSDPLSWEFSGFSQHGEDGIIDYLARRIRNANRHFVEIGCSNGLENNTTWLALARNYSGLMIDGDNELLKQCERLLRKFNYGVTFASIFATKETVARVHTLARVHHPDVFSLDIDGVDYYVADALLRVGFRPRIWVVEYNSAFGPDEKVTIPYSPNFACSSAERENLYYGCSIGAWHFLLENTGYRFVTVDSAGVNAFFVDPAEFDDEFLSSLRGLSFANSISHVREYGGDWTSHFEVLKHRPLVAL